MDFRIKSLIQGFLSALPRGEIINLFLQKNISHTVPASDDAFIVKIKQAESHISNYRSFSLSELGSKPRYMEFGAGWELMMPITMAARGFEVSCIDIRRLASIDLINHTLGQFKRLSQHLPTELKTPESIDSISDLQAYLGLKYIAPCDTRNTGLASNSFDFISTTSTLEHIPKQDLALILNECHRILKVGGVASMLIDYKDHYSYFDNQIDHYNFLQYSDTQWKKFNPSLHFQNRMRHSEYTELINGAGFEIVKEVAYRPTEKDLSALDSMNLAEKYKDWNKEDLGILGSEIVIRKANSNDEPDRN